MALKTRFFEHADVGEMLRLYTSAGLWFEEIGVNKEFILSSSGRPDFRFIVGEDGGKLVGFVGALYYTNVGRAELGPIAVGEEMRGSGVGRVLVEAMLRFLAENGIKRVFVTVKAENSGALSFFLKQGFWVEAYLRAYTLKNEDVVELMRTANDTI